MRVPDLSEGSQLLTRPPKSSVTAARDAATASRRARFQLVTADGGAWLVALDGGRWWLEAGYD